MVKISLLNYIETNLKKITNCKWITYLSATSVYGDHKGEWVTEKSETNRSSPNGLSRWKLKTFGKVYSEK